MPSSNPVTGTSLQQGRPRYIVPAVPLAPGKAKAKARQKAKAKAAVEQEHEEQIPDKVEEDGADRLSATMVSGTVTAATGADVLGNEQSAQNELANGTLNTQSNSISLNGLTAGTIREAPAMSSNHRTHESVSTAATSASPHPPIDRPEIVPVRTELPPAFVPSTGHGTPISATSSSHSRPPVFPSHGHFTRPSTGSIVFGDFESHGSSPAPPQSSQSPFQPPVRSDLHQSRNVSDSQVPRFPQQPQQQAQNNSHWFARQAYPPVTQTQSRTPHANASSRQFSREAFSTGYVQPNGHPFRSRSGSQTSSGPLEAYRSTQALPITSYDPNIDFGRIQDHRSPLSRQPFNSLMGPHPHMAHPDVVAALENAEALRNHISAQFANPLLADCQLNISAEGHGPNKSFQGHRILLSRSPVLSTLLQEAQLQATEDEILHLPITLKGRWLRLESFMDALRYLYGGPVLSIEQHRPNQPTHDHLVSIESRMEMALQHVAIGAWLKLPAFAVRGLDIVGVSLRWDNVGTVLGFALEGGLSHVWIVDDGSEDRLSSSSSDDLLNRPENLGTPVYDPFSTDLLQRIIGFVTHMFPLNFYLDTTAPELSTSPRLPSLLLGHESRPSRSDPRLSQIRFGDVPTEDVPRPSPATTVTSSVLLSLPFALLKCVLEHFDLAQRLGGDTVASIMRQVIAGRETRRIKVLTALAGGRLQRDGGDNNLVQNLYWEESVEPAPTQRAGFRLARRRRGIDTPDSSGTLSEATR